MMVHVKLLWSTECIQVFNKDQKLSLHKDDSRTLY